MATTIFVTLTETCGFNWILSLLLLEDVEKRNLSRDIFFWRVLEREENGKKQQEQEENRAIHRD